MTFSVVAVHDGREKKEYVVGTIWADGEAQAQLIASSVCAPGQNESIELRPADVREIPLRLPDSFGPGKSGFAA